MLIETGRRNPSAFDVRLSGLAVSPTFKLTGPYSIVDVFEWQVPLDANVQIAAWSLDKAWPHFDKERMGKTPFGDVIAQGIGAVARAVKRLEAFGLAVSDLEIGRFASPVYMGDEMVFGMVGNRLEGREQYRFTIEAQNMTHLSKDGKPSLVFKDFTVVAVPIEQLKFRKLDDPVDGVERIARNLVDLNVHPLDSDGNLLASWPSLAEISKGFRVAVKTVITDEMIQGIISFTEETKPIPELIPVGSVSRVLGCFPGSVIYLSTEARFANRKNRIIKEGNTYLTIVEVNDIEDKKIDAEGKPIRRQLNCIYSARELRQRIVRDGNTLESFPLVANGFASISIAA